MATKLAAGLRVILSAAFDRQHVSFIAEAQADGPPCTLVKQWGHTSWTRPRMPRAAAYLDALTADVIAWIKTEAPANNAPRRG
jgi:hypothetical protein